MTYGRIGKNSAVCPAALRAWDNSPYALSGTSLALSECH